MERLPNMLITLVRMGEQCLRCCKVSPVELNSVSSIRELGSLGKGHVIGAVG